MASAALTRVGSRLPLTAAVDWAFPLPGWSLLAFLVLDAVLGLLPRKRTAALPRAPNAYPLRRAYCILHAIETHMHK